MASQPTQHFSSKTILRKLHFLFKIETLACCLNKKHSSLLIAACDLYDVHSPWPLSFLFAYSFSMVYIFSYRKNIFVSFNQKKISQLAGEWKGEYKNYTMYTNILRAVHTYCTYIQILFFKQIKKNARAKQNKNWLRFMHEEVFIIFYSILLEHFFRVLFS